MNIHDPRVEEKPMVYFANWVPGHTDDGITLLVGRGEFQGDEAVNLRAKLKRVNAWAREIRSRYPLKQIWEMFRLKLQGHIQYYGVSFNM